MNSIDDLENEHPDFMKIEEPENSMQHEESIKIFNDEFAV